MGFLELLSGGPPLHLRPDHLIGRSDRTDLRIDDRSVSSEHARVRWTGRAWVLRDLGSKNGTWVDGARVQGDVLLTLGSRLAFGNESLAYRMASTLPPAISAVDQHGNRRFGSPDMLALPDLDNLVAAVVGEGGAFRIEHDGDERPVADGEVVEVGPDRFTLSLPEAPLGTWDRETPSGASLADAVLHFRVSLDEEHVELTVQVGGRTHQLGSRSHHYLLLVLARLRLEEAANPALLKTSQGWVAQESLVKMLGAREGALHTSVFRARAELSELGISDAAGVVERRKGSRQLRLGIARTTITTI
jgi:hypothetical protein